MLYVKDKPWAGVGRTHERPATNLSEILEGAGLDYQTAYLPMKTDQHETVNNWHAIFRQDTGDVLAAVNKPKIKMVQNQEMFGAVLPLIGNYLETIASGSFDNGLYSYGTFKINEPYKLIEDEIDHYVLLVNDRRNPDGKVTVLNTPFRIACSNMLSSIINNASAKFRIRCTDDDIANESIARFIQESVIGSKKGLEESAQVLLDKKYTQANLDKVMDELFPYIQSSGDSSHERANATMSHRRATFLNLCMGAEDLQNYKGTQYQIYSALTDFTQHYYMSGDKGIDLDARMRSVPGITTDGMVSKFMKIAPRLVA